MSNSNFSAQMVCYPDNIAEDSDQQMIRYIQFPSLHSNMFTAPPHGIGYGPPERKFCRVDYIIINP
jgi:hypothetical protein